MLCFAYPLGLWRQDPSRVPSLARYIIISYGFFCFPLHIHDCRITYRWECRWFCKSKHGQHFFKTVKKRMPSKIPSFSILPRLNCQCRKFLRQSAIEIFLSDSTSLAGWPCPGCSVGHEHATSKFLGMSIINYQNPCNIMWPTKFHCFEKPRINFWALLASHVHK